MNPYQDAIIYLKSLIIILESLGKDIKRVMGRMGL